jgi:ankyrin repeat protein
MDIHTKCFIDACFRNDIDKLYSMTQSCNIQLNTYHVNRIFYLLCKYGHAVSIKFLLFSLPDNYVLYRESKKTGFDQACVNGHVDIVNLFLMDNDIDTYIDTKYTMSILCENGHIEIVKLLVSKYNKLELNNVKYTLEKTCEKGYIEIVEFIFSFYKNINIEIVSHALQKACENGHVHIVKKIIELKDSSVINTDVFTIACKYGYKDIVDLLFVYIDKLNLNIHKGFWWSCYYGYIDIIKLFMSLRKEYYTEFIDNAFFIASQNGHSEVLSILLSMDHIE